MASRFVSQPAEHSIAVTVAAYTLQLTAELSTSCSLFKWSGEEEPHAILKKQGMHTQAGFPEEKKQTRSERGTAQETEWMLQHMHEAAARQRSCLLCTISDAAIL